MMLTKIGFGVICSKSIERHNVANVLPNATSISVRKSVFPKNEIIKLLKKI